MHRMLVVLWYDHHHICSYRLAFPKCGCMNTFIGNFPEEVQIPHVARFVLCIILCAGVRPQIISVHKIDP